MALPLIPHCDLDPECCGCLDEVIDDAGSKFVCNECGAVVSKEEVARIVMQIESCDATCPHCGRVNHISGFSEVFAFVCRYCGEGRRFAVRFCRPPAVTVATPGDDLFRRR
jgi:hypothetical protein